MIADDQTNRKRCLFLGQKSGPATKQDLSVGQDLQDTLAANQERCVGMAANMIGERKRIIIVNIGFMNLVTQDDPLSEHRGGISGWELEESPAEIFRMDSADHSS